MKVLRVAAFLASGFTCDAATELKLTWEDCGGSSKVESFTPATITTGQKATMSGTGKLPVDVTDGATFDLEMTGALGKMLSCKGDASASKTCNLPLGTGSVSFDAITFPWKAGQQSVNVELALSANVPAMLLTTTTTAKVTGKSGNLLVCMQIKTSKALDAQPLYVPQTDLKLTWKDCGGSSTVSSFTPATITPGQKATMTGTGNLPADVTDVATFDIEMTGALGKMLSCKGDASDSKTCNLPLGTGSVSFVGMTFPLKAGQQSVSVDLDLSANVPAMLLSTTTTAKVTGKSGNLLVCMEIKTSKAEIDVVV